jgi:hypothetical protein
MQVLILNLIGIATSVLAFLSIIIFPIVIAFFTIA